MTHCTSILIAMMTTVSLASMPVSGNELYGKHTATAAQPRTVTRSVPARANIPRIQKFKILHSNPRGVAINDWDDDFIDDDGVITSYRRRDLSKIEHPDDLSERVRWRLFLARQLALIIHRNKFG